jgi:hypothetical protein
MTDVTTNTNTCCHGSTTRSTQASRAARGDSVRVLDLQVLVRMSNDGRMRRDQFDSSTAFRRALRRLRKARLIPQGNFGRRGEPRDVRLARRREYAAWWRRQQPRGYNNGYARAYYHRGSSMVDLSVDSDEAETISAQPQSPGDDEDPAWLVHMRARFAGFRHGDISLV